MQQVTGYRPIGFLYLGAKDTVTGCDHLLFLAGVIILLYRAKDIATDRKSTRLNSSHVD